MKEESLAREEKFCSNCQHLYRKASIGICDNCNRGAVPKEAVLCRKCAAKLGLCAGCKTPIDL